MISKIKNRLMIIQGNHVLVNVITQPSFTSMATFYHAPFNLPNANC